MLGCVHLQAQNWVSNLFNNLKHLKSGCQEDGARLFSVVPRDSTGATGTNWSTGSSIWTWGRTSSLWGWRSPVTGCPGRLWILLLWRYSKPAWKRSFAACCRWPCFGRGVGPNDPQRSLPTPTTLWFCDSVIFWTADTYNYIHRMDRTIVLNSVEECTTLFLARNTFTLGPILGDRAVMFLGHCLLV